MPLAPTSGSVSDGSSVADASDAERVSLRDADHQRSNAAMGLSSSRHPGQAIASLRRSYKLGKATAAPIVG
jgi:hypothetical protein